MRPCIAKLALLCVLTDIFWVAAFGQGGLEAISFAPDDPGPIFNFEASLKPIASAPEVSPGGNADFTVAQGFFQGFGGFGTIGPVRFIHVENSQGQVMHEGVLVSYFPVPGTGWNAANVAWQNNREQLTQEQLSELFAGQWSVKIGLEGYPGSMIEGQIILVPEPSSGLIMILGIGLWLWLKIGAAQASSKAAEVSSSPLPCFVGI